MGSCVGKAPRTARRDLSKSSSKLEDKAVVLKTVSYELDEGHFIVKLLADVNILSSDDGPLRWESLFHGLVPVSLFCIKQGTVYSYRASATGVGGTLFNTNIHIPGTKLRKTSACFIQWRDTDAGGAWGLNFMTEDDAIKFLEGCSPPTLTPGSERLRYTRTLSSLSLSLPIPEPPSGGGDTQLDDVILQLDSKCDRLESAHRVLDSTTPTLEGPHSPYDLEGVSPSMSPTSSSLSDEDHILFEPSSPLKVIPKDFTLPDIEEECEESMSRPMSLASELESPLEDYTQKGDVKLRDKSNKQSAAKNIYRRSFDYMRQSFEAAGLDVIETKFDNLDEDHPQFSDPLLDKIVNTMAEMSTSLESVTAFPTEAPFLPVSPPPGPLLSPRYSMLLAALEESKAHAITAEDKKRASAMINRLSTISLADDEPPPLPETLPPDLISPRQAESPEQSQLDLSILLSKVTEIYDGKKKSSPKTSRGKSLLEKLEEEQLLALLPPPDTEDDDDESLQRRKSILKLTPSFLRSIEPPQEFTDSGIPDTDDPPVMSDQILNIPGIAQKALASELRHRKDSSTTVTTFSEEKQSECSGSTGLKTNASTSSQLSAVNQSHEEDANSLSTKAGRIGEQHTATLPDLRNTENEPIIRKAGWLELKPVLVSKNGKVGNAAKTKRKWKKHWATLKGLQLLLYQCDDESSLREDALIDSKLDLELCLVHSIHEHVKRDHIFCIITANGNAYHLQALTQSEVDDWITAIHCVAAIAVTGQMDREASVIALKQKMEDLNKSIEKEKQLKNLSELNLVASDPSTRAVTENEVQLCSDNIEKYSVELYRLRCYIASLEAAEQPNPQTLLSSTSKQTKLALVRVGIFSVSGLTAQVNARHGLASSLNSPAPTSPSLSRRNSKKKAKSSDAKLSVNKSLRSLGISDPLPMVKPKVSAVSLLSATYDSCDQWDTTDMDGNIETEGSIDDYNVGLNFVSVGLPSGKHAQLIARNDMTVKELLSSICEKHQFNCDDHYVRLKLMTCDGVYGIIPSPEEFLADLTYTSIDIVQKFVHSVVLTRGDADPAGFGFELAPFWGEDNNLIAATVLSVDNGGMAQRERVHAGDEIKLVNDTSIPELGWTGLKDLVHSASSLSLTVRTCLIDLPLCSIPSAQIMDGLIPAPPPSSHTELSGEMLKSLTIPNPDSDNGLSSGSTHDLTGENLQQLMKHSKEMSRLLRVWKIEDALEDNSQWTKEDKLKKSATDLLETEAEYIRNLNTLIERYLVSLQKESLLSKEELEILCGDIVQLVEAQKEFFSSLKDSVSLVEDMQPAALKRMVQEIACLFLERQTHFQRYCTFCASHQKAQDLSARVEDEQLQSFLEARNPHQDSSLTLNTLLSKPIVRISRYPLFMGAILDNTDKESEERKSIREAIQMMSSIVTHINEMQRICEAYQLVFESILKSSTITEIDLSINISELRYHGEAKWLNPTVETLSRGLRKGQGPVVNCFVFKTVIILICTEKKQKRKESKGVRGIAVADSDISYKALLPCVYCRLNDLPNSDGVSNMWQVQFRPKTDGLVGTNYLFRNNDPEDKQAFIRWIDYVITDHRRLHSGSLPGSGRSTPSLTSPTHSPALTKLPGFRKTTSLSPLSQ